MNIRKLSSKRYAGTALVAAPVVFAAALLVFDAGPVLAVGPVLADGTAAPVQSVSPKVEASADAAGEDDALIAKVRAAVLNHDLEFFDKHLVDWDGARKRTQRLTLFQIRECFGRPIKSVAIEPLKPDPATPLVPEGFRTNLPVTHVLRIAFDEQHAAEETPACVFMLSKDPKASYRMVLVLPTAPPPK